MRAAVLVLCCAGCSAGRGLLPHVGAAPTVRPAAPELAPVEARGWYVVGQAAAARGDDAHAAYATDWLLRLDPHNPWAEVAAARIDRARGHAQASWSRLHAVRDVLEHDPTYLREVALSAEAVDPASAMSSLLAAARAGAAELWPRAYRAASGPQRAAVWQAWSAADIPAWMAAARADVARERGDLARAGVDAAVAMTWVPSAEALLRWDATVDPRCADGPVDWVTAHQPRSWSADWAAAVDVVLTHAASYDAVVDEHVTGAAACPMP